jgi:hypothetical protein
MFDDIGILLLYPDFTLSRVMRNWLLYANSKISRSSLTFQDIAISLPPKCTNIDPALQRLWPSERESICVDSILSQIVGGSMSSVEGGRDPYFPVLGPYTVSALCE